MKSCAEYYTCCVCYKCLDNEIYKCPEYSHFMCEKCFLLMNEQNCPFCFDSILIRNQYIEKKLDKYKKECRYINCKTKSLNIMEHEDNCSVIFITCLFCAKSVE